VFRAEVVEKIKTYILCSIIFFPENIVVCELLWNNIAEPGRSQMTIRRMCVACWIPKATNTLSQYVIIIAFPVQQCLNQCASLLPYTYIECLVLVMRDFECNTLTLTV
jgi:hypothetical protein